VPVYKEGDRTDCSNYRGISLLSASYTILTSTLLSRLSLYTDEINGDRHCGFRRNRSTTDQIFCIRQIIHSFVLLLLPLERRPSVNRFVSLQFLNLNL
jgi:hypothetical protein